MTLREQQRETEKQLRETLSKVLGTERAVKAETIVLIHQRLTLMEKLHDFTMNFPNDNSVDILDADVEELTKLLDEAVEKEDETEPT